MPYLIICDPSTGKAVRASYVSDLPEALAVGEREATRQEFEAFRGFSVAADGTIATVPSVPETVSIVQATLALHEAPGSAPGKTLLDDVEAAVTAATDARVQLAWRRATTLDRHGLFVTQMAAGLGLDDAKLDALFVAAAGIAV